MARPEKEFIMKRNGDSFQFFVNHEYVGSRSVKELCLLEKKRKGLT
jgi:hypothetical protein